MIEQGIGIERVMFMIIHRLYSFLKFVSVLKNQTCTIFIKNYMYLIEIVIYFCQY